MNIAVRQLLRASTIAASFFIFSTSAIAATESVIYSLPVNSYPVAHPLMGSTGKLYGTTLEGGAGYGTVYELTEKRGVWKSRTIHQFANSDGAYPYANLIQDLNGVLYGTTDEGGIDNGGTVYSLSSGETGWTETVLHSFTGGVDGVVPDGNLLFDKTTGVFYGTAAGGGASGCGTVFDLTESAGTWTLNPLYGFLGGSDGCTPVTGVRDLKTAGTLYGTTSSGGEHREGTVYALTESGGVWKESPLYSFSRRRSGEGPTDLYASKDGTLYGVTVNGGAHHQGVLFQLSEVRKVWLETVIHTFAGGADGTYPVGLHVDQATGSIYVTTEEGGTYNKGTAFEFTPNGGS